MAEGMHNTDEGKKHTVNAAKHIWPFKQAKGVSPPSITDKLSMLSRDSLNINTVRIYKVPEKHRNKNQEAYMPRLVSIGLIHYGESQLQNMEEQKLKYLHHFLHTFRVGLDNLTEYVLSQEKFVMDCYEETYRSNLSKKFKVQPHEVILLDGIFVVELFLKNHFPGMREKGDIIYENPWVSDDILHDLLLFENQLPLRFLTTLYDTFVFKDAGRRLDYDIINPPSFNELAYKYFSNVGVTGKLLLPRDFRGARHFIEFLSILHMPTEQNWDANSVRQQVGIMKSNFALCPTATELRASGVRFQRGKGKHLLNVGFDSKKGVLRIPPLVVNDSTETFLRNLIAFEQSGYHSKFMTSYVILMDNLVNTHKDVDLLIKYNIIRNELGSSEQVADLFNNLYKEFVTDPREFYFMEQCRQLNDYSRDWWHMIVSTVRKWFSILERDYFNTPWSIISVIAAAVLLVLTVVQTVCSVLQVKH
ncbi:OLC1v1036847C1 [Oldenlandia corymbosa var. corymbosa]|uniref:OLC1v1036847C1 n=1 Tax=Oldenlandia corymbosa var. corymbosa TaxID=529605 RepID=A0AAV1CZJ9_OLDCO|nr:OLC1v1036847C1 [Oldenlandia corymbosa var. corymbosa]